MNPHRCPSPQTRCLAESAPVRSRRRRLAYSLLTVTLAAIAGCTERDAVTAPAAVVPRFSQTATDPVVNSLADPGDGTCDDAGTGDGCTLREAIALANPLAATITFDPALTSGGAQAITLDPARGQLGISKNLTIVGPGADLLTVRRAADAPTPFRIIEIQQSTRGIGTRNIVTIAGLTISGGFAGAGGGIANFVVDNSLTLSRVVVSGNTATEGTAGAGGGIFYRGELTIDGSTISGNSATLHGAGVMSAGGAMFITNSTISDNHAGSEGGGILHLAGTMTLQNVSISGNSAFLGGGISKQSSSGAALSHVTIAGNSANHYGGIYSVAGLPPIALSNTIVANNTGASGSCGSSSPTPAIADGGGNLVYPASSSCDGIAPITTGDPKLGALALNAPGITATMALGEGSAAIDAGLPGACTAQDQRGVVRPQGTRCDIGAYEGEQEPPPPDATPVVNSLADPGDGTCDDAGTGDGCTLREAIDHAASFGATITFDPALTAAGPQVISLGSQLSIQKSVTIVGPGANLMTVRRAPEAATDFGTMDIRGFVSVEIKGLTISGGRGGSGIAAFFSDTWITLRRVVISGNTATGGAGIYTAAQMTIDSSTISGNQATASNGKGAGIYAAGGNLTVTNSTISGNAASDIGGGIFHIFATVSLTNVTVSGNSALIGGGYGKESGSATFNHVTIAGNSANTYGGIYSLTNRPNVTLANTIVASNNGSGGQCGSFGDVAIADAGGNLVYPAPATCAGITPVTTGDPKLGSLSLNAPGTTATRALGAGSAAIDAALVSSCQTHDQRGVARPQGAGCDIGAYEAEPSADATPPVITPSVNGTLGSNDWYRGNVTVSWSVTDGESAVTSVPCAPTTISADTPGQVVTCGATSAGGSSSQSVTIKRDATAPSLAPAVAPSAVLLNGAATATPNATDALSGVATSSCGTPTTASVGSKSVSCSATDNAGNSATASAAYSVAYQFVGFSGPVLGGGTLNVAKAGQNIPLKWRLLDAAGAPVTNLTTATVTAANLACTAASTATGELAAAAAGGGAALRNLGDGYYQYNWSTPKSYANSCKTMQLNLGEGTTHDALFRFTK